MAPHDANRDHDESADREDRRLARTLFWVGLGIGIAALGATLAYVAVRIAAAADRLEDPTSQRIQQLIDEANSLLKALDDQRHSA